MTKDYGATDFRRFLQAEQTRVRDAYREVEQVQVEFQGRYTRFKVDHDRTLAALAEQVDAALDRLDPGLRKQIQARVPEERKQITDRMAVLNQESPKLQSKADGVMADSQQRIAGLRALNPKLNVREESLKADAAKTRQALDALNAQVSGLGRGLGFITHVGKIHSLDRERFQAIGRLEALENELAKVRTEWKDKHAEVTQRESQSQLEWAEIEKQLGQLREENERLSRNTDALALQRATVYVLDNLKTPAGPTEPSLDAGLKQMIDLNIQTDAFQDALGAVAGVLGTAKGMEEGLNRLTQSVTALIQEQSTNSTYLSPLSITLSDDLTTFNGIWDDIAMRAKDEQALADHPADFVAAMKPLTDSLTQDRIAAFFDGLGQAIKQATAGWTGSGS